MKIPPRTVFSCQIAASIWAVFVQIAVMNWTLGALDNVCTEYAIAPLDGQSTIKLQN
jgi:hypothetical protein